MWWTFCELGANWESNPPTEVGNILAAYHPHWLEDRIIESMEVSLGDSWLRCGCSRAGSRKCVFCVPDCCLPNLIEKHSRRRQMDTLFWIEARLFSSFAEEKLTRTKRFCAFFPSMLQLRSDRGHGSASNRIMWVTAIFDRDDFREKGRVFQPARSTKRRPKTWLHDNNFAPRSFPGKPISLSSLHISP